MIRYFAHRDGHTELVDRLDPSASATAAADRPAWPEGVAVWADMAEPTEADAAVLRDVFGLHELPVEAAVQRETQPKVESYGRYLYIVLHGINFQAAEHTFETHETDAFLAPNFLVTIHDGQRHSIAHVAELCSRAHHDSIVFQDRVTGILDAYLASVSNRLANTSRLLAVIAALFGPMTVITGLFGMNVPLTLLGSPEYQFWEIVGMMVVSSAIMFTWFKKSGWW